MSGSFFCVVVAAKGIVFDMVLPRFYLKDTMKSYPSITKDIRTDISIHAFDKKDGSQIRAEWSKKQAFYKFGTKNRMLGADDPIFGSAIDLVKKKYEKDLTSIFEKNKYQSVICFFEFYGENSFAGNHYPNDIHDVILFDVNPFKQGILDPKEFMYYFGHLDIPKELYFGKANNMFVDSVRNGSLPGMTFEGVVCKSKNDKKTKMPIMFKIKNKAWIDRLKDFCKEDKNLFNQLL